MVKLAKVILFDELIGALALDDNSMTAVFEYTPEWIKKGIEISPIHLPLSHQKFQFTHLNYETYKGLPSVFADSLPDDFGNAIINAWLARQGLSIDNFTAIDRLLYTGTKGMGALEYKPETKKYNKSQTIQLDSLVAVAQKVLDDRNSLEVGIDEESMEELIQIGASAGGARAKAIIGINNDRTIIKSGQATLPKGFEHYLLKFDGVNEKKSDKETFGDPKGFGRIEYAYYLMAKECGINISHSELIEEGGRAHFMTRRFDRIHNKKIHYLSLCAMDHADYKLAGAYSYEQLFSLMRKLKSKREDAIEIIRRMVFNIVSRNHDDHTKNFGFLMSDTGEWRLSPAFDLTYSYKKDSPWVNEHQLTINGKRDNFNYDDIIRAVPESLEKETHVIIEKTIDIVSNWKIYANKSGVEQKNISKIQENHRLNFK